MYSQSSIEQLVDECERVLKRFYGSRLSGVVLYGSARRGEMDEESDIDLLVLLDGTFDYFVELRRIVDLLYPLQLKSDRLISAKPAAASAYQRGELQLYRNAQ